MNNNYYPMNMNFANTRSLPGSGTGTQPPIQNIMDFNQMPSPQPPYAENLLKQNQGKEATFYMSYSDSVEWRDKIFRGIIEDSGRDYALLHDTKTGKRILLWTVYLDYVEFDEPINHY